MSLQLYMDEHVERAITEGLLSRGVDVLTVQDDGMNGCSDSELLDRATELNRVFFTRDEDFTREASQRQRSGKGFPGIIYVPKNKTSIGRAISDLELICLLGEPEDFSNRLEYLPLK